MFDINNKNISFKVITLQGSIFKDRHDYMMLRVFLIQKIISLVIVTKRIFASKIFFYTDNKEDYVILDEFILNFSARLLRKKMFAVKTQNCISKRNYVKMCYQSNFVISKKTKTVLYYYNPQYTAAQYNFEIVFMQFSRLYCVLPTVNSMSFSLRVIKKYSLKSN